MTIDEMRVALTNVTYPGYTFAVMDSGGTVYLQAQYEDIDIATGQPSIQKTRKWLLSEHMVKHGYGIRNPKAGCTVKSRMRT